MIERLLSYRRDRRPALFVIVVFLLCCPVFAAAYAIWHLHVSRADLPILRLPDQSHDFGIILPNANATYSFIVRNPLDETLTIDQIEKSCGCTAAQMDLLRIPPEGTCLLETTLTARGLDEGIESHVTLFAHAGPQRIQADFDLRVEVQNLIEFPGAAGYLDLGQLMLDQLPEDSIVRVKRGKYPLAFDALQVDSAIPELSAVATPAGADDWIIKFHLQSAETLGNTGAPVTFHFLNRGHRLLESLDKQAYFEVLGPLVASPPSLLFTLAPCARVRKIITLARRNSPGAAPQISAVATDSRAVISGFQNGASISQAIIDYTAKANTGEDRGAINISASLDGHMYSLKVGYLAVVAQN